MNRTQRPAPASIPLVRSGRKAARQVSGPWPRDPAARKALAGTTVATPSKPPPDNRSAGTQGSSQSLLLKELHPPSKNWRELESATAIDSAPPRRYEVCARPGEPSGDPSVAPERQAASRAAPRDRS